ncbi:MAG: hypothetical protein H0X08_03260 [Blastocatellia bacterium]|nr:hypothetical protein [Blastocatellia bacterium]
MASIGAAIWAFVEARKAGKFASTVERIKDELVSRRNLVEVSQVYREANRAIAALTAVGPSCTSSSVRGLNCSLIAAQVLEFVTFLNTHRAGLPEALRPKVNLLVLETKKEVSLLAEAKTFEAKKSAGTAIYYKIASLMPEIKVLADEKNEDI